MRASRLKLFIVSAAALALCACGGGAGKATIAGNVSGLGAGLSLTLQNNGADNLTVQNNQSFAFATQIASGNSYSVTVLNQPTGSNCVVVNASGTVDTLGDNIGNVTVTCAVTASVGGTVSGLGAGTSVTLANNGMLLPIDVNGGFSFPGILPAGTAYNVTVSTQAAGEICAVANPSGTTADNTMSFVTVTCI